MSKIIATAVAAAALCAAMPALAGEAPSKTLNVAKVNFRDTAAVEAFYGELARTANAVCNSGSNNAILIEEDRACARKTLTEAVSRLNRPVLTALHNNEKAASAIQFAAR